ERAPEYRPLGSDGIQDSGQISDTGLEVRGVDVATRGTGSAAVMQDETRKRGEATEPLRRGLVLPDGVDVPQPIELPDDVDRAISHRLVGDVDALRGLGIFGLGGVHGPNVSSVRPQPQP